MSDDLIKFLIELNSISDNIGIYPQAVKGMGEQSYEQRDGFKNGWNACVIEFGYKLNEAADKAGIPWTSSENLFSNSDGNSEYHIFSRHDNHWVVFLNDTWYYACADIEIIQKEEYNVVAKWFRKFGEAGVYYWVYLKRGHMPDIPRTKKLVEMVKNFVESNEKK